jgi:hypothetical protein
MWRALTHLLHRPAVRFGLARDARSRFRNPRFVSFIAQSNRRTLDTHFQDALLRSRKLLRHALVALLIGTCAWVALESARALSMF